MGLQETEDALEMERLQREFSDNEQSHPKKEVIRAVAVDAIEVGPLEPFDDPISLQLVQVLDSEQ